VKYIFFKSIFAINHFIRRLIQASEKYAFLVSHKHVDSSFKFNYILSTFETQNPSKLVIEKGVMFGDFCNIMLFKNSSLIIKDGVFMNRYCSINCLGKIVIGSNTIFGEGVKIYDHNHRYGGINNGLNIKRTGLKIGKVLIGSNCWIGSNVTILSNVEIGDNVVIGANLLVYKSIKSGSVIVNDQNYKNLNIK